jgi:hypothetical protein
VIDCDRGGAGLQGTGPELTASKILIHPTPKEICRLRESHPVEQAIGLVDEPLQQHLDRGRRRISTP